MGQTARETVTVPLNNGNHDEKNFSTTIEAIRFALKSMREKAMEEDRHKSLHEHVAKRTLHAVKAAFAVEKKTVTDAILKKTRDIAIQARDEWISATLLTDMRIRESAVEDADVGARRARNTEVSKAMQAVLSELSALTEMSQPPETSMDAAGSKRKSLS